MNPIKSVPDSSLSGCHQSLRVTVFSPTNEPEKHNDRWVIKDQNHDTPQLPYGNENPTCRNHPVPTSTRVISPAYTHQLFLIMTDTLSSWLLHLGAFSHGRTVAVITV